MNDQDRFLEHLGLIERAARSASARAKLSPEEVEDFVSIAKLKCIENDYRVFRRHRGESRITTYLIAVINNLCRDHVDHLRGRFRPSARARELGYAAEVLERLLVRDEMSFAAAVSLARQRFMVSESSEQLEKLAAELPSRPRRKVMSDSTLDYELPSTAPSPELHLEDRRRIENAQRVEEILDEALVALDAQDLLILKMHLGDGQSLAAVARGLGLEQQSLYSRKRRCLRTLKRHFTARGLTWDEVEELLGWREYQIRSPLTVVKEAARAVSARAENPDGGVL